MNMELANWIKEALTKLKVIQGKPQDILVEKGMIVACPWCEKEHAISQYDIKQKAQVMISHKTCIRHLPHMIDITFGKAEPKFSQYVQKYLLNAIQRFNENDGKEEPRDLSRPENRHLLDWFKNPQPIT